MRTDPPTDCRRLCQPGEDSDNIKIDTKFENLIPDQDFNCWLPAIL